MTQPADEYALAFLKALETITEGDPRNLVTDTMASMLEDDWFEHGEHTLSGMLLRGSNPLEYTAFVDIVYDGDGGSRVRHVHVNIAWQRYWIMSYSNTNMQQETAWLENVTDFAENYNSTLTVRSEFGQGTQDDSEKAFREMIMKAKLAGHPFFQHVQI